MLIHDPIDNQKFADIAGVSFDQRQLLSGPIVYGITHWTWGQLDQLANNGPCVLVTSYSDASLHTRYTNKLPPNVVKWFSTNVMTNHPRVEAIPIGFAYKREHQKICMGLCRRGRRREKNLVYMNFLRSIPRNPNPRDGLYERFGGRSWITTKGGTAENYTPIQEFYRDVQSHPYVLSPPGAGLDCHRHWEAMALGSIPIVLRSKATEILEDMPALLVDDWGQVSESLLLDELQELRAKFSSPTMRKMDMQYWRERIQDEVNRMWNT